MVVRRVTIIGAGPAGSVAAIVLARGGWAVTLLEQHRFPRDKVCGECLSAVGVDVLRRLGVLEQLLAAGAVWLTRTIFHSGQSGSSQVGLPRPMLGLSRQALDWILLSAARNAGAAVRQPVRCEGIEPSADGCRLRLRELESNAVSTTVCESVIIADGKGGMIGRAPKPTGDIGVKAHWTGVEGPRDAIELFACRGCYGGLASIEGQRWNTAFSVPAARVRAHHGNLSALFNQVLAENEELGRRLRGARQEGGWLASPLPRFAVRKHWPPNVIPIGNAAAAMEPIGGEGMGLAIASAELAAAQLIETPRGWNREHEAVLRRSYRKLWNVRRIACRAAASVVSSRTGAEAALHWMNHNERLAQPVMRAMGKT